MLRDIWKRLQMVKKPMNKKEQLLLVLLVGVLLALLSAPTKKEKQEQEKEQVQETTNPNICKVDEMEKRLEKILCKVEGAGNLSVMITYASTSEKIVEKDKIVRENLTEEETVYMDGEGSEKIPYVYMEKYPKVEGVVVVCEGADSAIVVRNLTEAVLALFDVDTHKIKIMKGG